VSAPRLEIDLNGITANARVLVDRLGARGIAVTGVTKATLGSNSAHLTVRVDPRTGWVVAICAIDNLTKGASGQAVQCANAVLGLPETTGLDQVGVYP